MKQEVAEAIIRWEDHDDAENYTEVTSPEIYDQGRWETSFSQVFRDCRDNSFWEISWTRGSTEFQDEGPENIEVRQVWPHQVTVTQYKPEEPKGVPYEADPVTRFRTLGTAGGMA
jgi:hypothetical protein